jgi:hypothetical protein
MRQVTRIGSVPASRGLLGGAFLLLAVAIAATALWLALEVAMKRRPSLLPHAALLAFAAVAVALRSIAG